MQTAFLLVAGILAIVELTRTKLNSLLAWAILSIVISFLFPLMR